VFLSGRLRLEVQVFDRDREPVPFSPVQEADERVPHLGITVLRAAGHVVVKAARITQRVAVGIQMPGGQMVGVGVHTDHTSGPDGSQGDGLDQRDRPGRGQIPAAAPDVLAELARRTGISAAGVSQHLTALRDAGMVSAHRAGRSVLYARTAIAESFLGTTA
jgi:hypothetical protein